jgi:hypothetical protein
MLNIRIPIFSLSSFFFFFFLCPTNQLHLSIKINENLDLEYLDSLCFWILNSDSNFFFIMRMRMLNIWTPLLFFFFPFPSPTGYITLHFFSFISPPTFLSLPLKLALSLFIFIFSSLISPPISLRLSLPLQPALSLSTFICFPLLIWLLYLSLVFCISITQLK